MRPKVKETEENSNGFLKVRRDLLENAHGHTITFTSIHLPQAVAVLAQTPDGLWVVNKEYRHPTGEVLLGPPGGRLDPGEEPLQAAQRELFEETGYWSDELILLGSCHPFPGICDQRIHYVLAKNAIRKSAPTLEPFEFIEVALLSDAELRKQLRQGHHVDGNLCIAHWYYTVAK